MEAQIIQNAFTLMKRVGLRNLTLDMLAHETGVSKKTIYVHFASKEEVILASIKSLVDDFDRINGEVLASGINPLLKVIGVLHNNLSQVLGFHESFFFELRKYHQLAFHVLEEYGIRLMAESVVPLFNECKEKQVLLESVDTDLYCRIYLTRLKDTVINSGLGHFRDYNTLFLHLVVLELRGLLRAEHIHLLDHVLLGDYRFSAD
jgi:AcrR family transcriptional regulator